MTSYKHDNILSIFYMKISSAGRLLPVLALSLSSVILLTEIKDVVSVRSEALISFGTRPKHNVDKGTCDCSPYVLGFASFLQSAGGTGGGKYCFLVSFRGCEPHNACCDAFLQDRVDSLHVQTGSTCLRRRQAISSVEVNGSHWEQWDVDSGLHYDARSSSNGYGGVRIYGLSADSETLPGTTICFSTNSSEHCSEPVEQMLCDSSSPCRFAVTIKSPDSGKDSKASVAVCPVLGTHRRAKLIEEVSVRLSSPRPAVRPMSSPRRSPPVPAVAKPPTRRLQPPSPRRSLVPPSPKRSPSPPPPSPSPPPLSLTTKSSDAVVNQTSEICGAITLVSPVDASGALTYSFGRNISCDEAAAWMAKNLTDAAQEVGAKIAIPFTLESCSTSYQPPSVLPTVVVCGSFTSVEEAAKIQDKLDVILGQWRFLVLGRRAPSGAFGMMCAPPGYIIQSMVWGNEEESPVGFLDVQCASRSSYPPERQP